VSWENWFALPGTPTQIFASSETVQEDIVQSMQEGQTIKHEVYGLGVVTASDQERTAVDFDDHGPKLFVTSIRTAELIGEAPATPPKTKRRRKASTAAKAAKKAAAATAAAARA
jgi:topoisomerase IA-like protein